jgi:hypothetical protein
MFLGFFWRSTWIFTASKTLFSENPTFCQNLLSMSDKLLTAIPVAKILPGREAKAKTKVESPSSPRGENTGNLSADSPVWGRGLWAKAIAAADLRRLGKGFAPPWERGHLARKNWGRAGSPRSQESIFRGSYFSQSRNHRKCANKFAPTSLDVLGDLAVHYFIHIFTSAQ